MTNTDTNIRLPSIVMDLVMYLSRSEGVSVSKFAEISTSGEVAFTTPSVSVFTNSASIARPFVTKSLNSILSKALAASIKRLRIKWNDGDVDVECLSARDSALQTRLHGSEASELHQFIASMIAYCSSPQFTMPVSWNGKVFYAVFEDSLQAGRRITAVDICQSASECSEFTAMGDTTSGHKEPRERRISECPVFIGIEEVFREADFALALPANIVEIAAGVSPIIHATAHEFIARAVRIRALSMAPYAIPGGCDLGELVGFAAAIATKALTEAIEKGASQICVYRQGNKAVVRRRHYSRWDDVVTLPCGFLSKMRAYFELATSEFAVGLRHFSIDVGGFRHRVVYRYHVSNVNEQIDLAIAPATSSR